MEIGMQTSRLAALLKERYDNVADKKKAVEVVLFGVEYAEVLKTQSEAAVCAAFGIGKWGPQIALGINLAAKVKLKP